MGPGEGRHAGNKERRGLTTSCAAAGLGHVRPDRIGRSFFLLFQCEKYGFPFSGQLDFWDFRYYMTMIEETKYAVDHEKLREYFPMDKVTKGLLEIYQELLGLKFTQVPQENAWHEDVTLVMKQ